MNNILKYGLITLVIIFLGTSIYLFIQNKSKDSQLVDLRRELFESQSSQRIDKQTIASLGGKVDDLTARLETVDTGINQWLKERDYDPRFLTITKTLYQVDTLRLKADTVYKDHNFVEFGQSNYTDPEGYFGINSTWSCDPYQIIYNKVWFRDKLTQTIFETEDKFGVITRSSNPFAQVDSVTFYYDKPKQNKWSAGIGLGTNDKFDITAIGEINYGNHSIWGTLNLSRSDSLNILQKGVSSDDWRAGYKYIIK